MTGPDEYSAVADDNVFTNLMAVRNLRAALAACGRYPERAGELGVTGQELAAWQRAARSVAIPYDSELGVHEQSQGFTRYREWDFVQADAQDAYPLLLHAPYVELYRSQVCKQADLLLALHWCGEHFSAADKARNVDYYERRTVRDSSLSACTQAVTAAEVGHLDLAYAYAREAALIDLHDLHANSRDGLHLASLAGAWTALVEGFGGMRVREDGTLHFDPALPEGLDRLAFHLRWRGGLVHVAVDHEQATYSVQGVDLSFHHDGEDLTLADGQSTTRAVRARTALLPAPPQPVGRAPARGKP